MNCRILSQIALNAKNQPHKIALIGDDSEISYKNLWKIIEETSLEIKKLPHDKIALIGDNSINWIMLDLAFLNTNKTLIPLPHFFTKTQIDEILISEKIAATLCNDDLLAKALLPENFKEKELFYLGFKMFETQNFVKNATSEICKITFTSGSTKEPKPIALSKLNIDEVVFSLLAEIGSENIENNLVILPLSILLENIAGGYLPLIFGGSATIKSLKFSGISNSSSFDIASFINAILTTNPTSFIASPEIAKILVHLVSTQKISPKNFKFIAVGGAKVSQDLIAQAHQLNIPLFQGYGLSEATSVVALNSHKNNNDASVGKVLPHLEIKICDDEILIKGKSLAQNIVLDDDGFYATGDLGFVDKNGFLFIFGRRKNIFITSMMRNVSPEWIESEILKSFLVAQVAVFGEAMPFNSAVVVASNLDVTLSQIQLEFNKINKTLPDYANVKNIILAKEPFSQKNGMLTGNGRIKREKIWQEYQKNIIPNPKSIDRSNEVFLR